MIRHPPLLAILAPLCLAACGQQDNAPGPGGVTVGEARALDEAAAALDEQTATPATDNTAARRPIAESVLGNTHIRHAERLPDRHRGLPVK
ncbi:hypothetical protein [Sphingomonas flavalba]|uniref:hypothetical protein n=1 Tax=Sphingomonas flavalba TaxID=2559804 RepID=UPI00109E31E8|nr:hypothetical protein [Sphingomonas flavalba]